jgi:hypothetical protein
MPAAQWGLETRNSQRKIQKRSMSIVAFLQDGGRLIVVPRKLRGVVEKG